MISFTGGNVEVAEMECARLEEFVRCCGRVHHSTAKGIHWRPVPINRLREKLTLAAEYSERIVSWGYCEYCRPELSSQVTTWRSAYRGYLKSLSK
jgi:hypothetical protein